ncbi:hypothetical protein QVA66_02170 [Staphylococcus chromogenes]|nr:hypothetical protein [Staphylococcus chromogenes]
MNSIRGWIAGISSAVILGAIVLAGFDDNTSKPMLLNGDAVGMDHDETFYEYQHRIAPTLHREGEGFALVSFAAPVNVDKAGQLATQWPVGRVNAVTLPDSAPVAVPEPIAPETRREVFARAQRNNPDIRDRISGAVVYGQLADIRVIAASPEVASVEVLPEDAAWGRFGIRPVDPSKR